MGANRDLKFSLEKYWQGQIDEASLQETAKTIRLKNFQLYKEQEIDYTPVGEFSFYDQVLDTILLTSSVPAAYKAISSNPLDQYFALARGYQKEGNTLPALALKKWFNTNYHYLVPELPAQPSYAANTDRLVGLVKEAQEAGVSNPVPVLVGPLTFLSLASFEEGADFEAHRAALTQTYRDILDTLASNGIETVQIDEPILVLNPQPVDQAAFESTYQSLSQASVDIHLQTYFDSLVHNYSWVTALPVKGIGIDLVHGSDTLETIKAQGFPESKRLLAGLVDGRNIWSLDVEKAQATLDSLKSVVSEDRLVVSSSCSFLHLPYSLEPETALEPEVKSALAFATEKTAELKALAQQDTAALKALAERRATFVNNPNRKDDTVRSAIKDILAKNRGRKDGFEARIKEQEAVLNLPLFPTTTIGSFPQTPEVRAKRRQWRNGELSEADYETFVNEQMQRLVQFQESIGLDMLVHGEFERNDMVEFFGEKLKGYHFTKNAWVQSYGSRCVKPPIIYGDISRPEAMTVKEIAYAQTLTEKAMKGMLTGPVTILNWSFVRDDLSRQAVCEQIALGIRQEVLDLEAAGIKAIQVDEAAFREGLPLQKQNQQAYLDWSVDCFLISVEAVENKTQIHTHMCYSSFNEVMGSIIKMDADVISIENSRGKEELLRAFETHNYPNQIGPGVYDIHSPNIPSTKDMATKLESICKILKPEQVWVNPDCGLKTRKEAEVEPALKEMVNSAKQIRIAYAKQTA